MALEASLTELQAEASCPLCQDYLRDPVTLGCGHNFCDSCIQQRWEDLEDIFPCPVCLHHCPDRNFRRNHQLHLIIDIIKLVPRRTERKRQEERLCETHNEVLDQFCEEDAELLCPQCRVSSDHQDHHLISIERAAENQRKKLKICRELLKRQIEENIVACRNEVSKFIEESRKMENCRMELHPEFEEFKLFLRKEKAEINVRLMQEEKELENKLAKNKSHISNHMDTLKNLLSEVIVLCSLDDLDLLSRRENIHRNYEDLPSPTVISRELKKESLTLPPHYFGLQKMISTFHADLTLDPATAHPSLIISKNKKIIIFRTSLPDLGNSQTFTPYAAVLGSEGFDGGRHFWQVEVKGRGEWSLGVCEESYHKNTLMSPTRENGCWSFEQSTRATKQAVRGVQIGVFLDYEMGEISIYNLSRRSYLHKLTGIFTEKLMPYFAVRASSKHFSISLVTIS
ncbi:tripartite motif-containing protein 75-like [Sorex araneus]|uniref:tripartite motif-containing protein 75-like n=1 Tax=Sorex araneus TaxID=42254 RepID=UPI002433AD4E|nr:tripartite motif-containing protein 75-like [Sorex araneus]